MNCSYLFKAFFLPVKVMVCLRLKMILQRLQPMDLAGHNQRARLNTMRMLPIIWKKKTNYVLFSDFTSTLVYTLCISISTCGWDKNPGRAWLNEDSEVGHWIAAAAAAAAQGSAGFKAPKCPGGPRPPSADKGKSCNPKRAASIFSCLRHLARLFWNHTYINKIRKLECISLLILLHSPEIRGLYAWCNEVSKGFIICNI